MRVAAPLGGGAVPGICFRTQDAGPLRHARLASWKALDQKKAPESLPGPWASQVAGADQNAGTTAPLYFSLMNWRTSSLCSAAASFCMASLSLLSGRATRMFT